MKPNLTVLARTAIFSLGIALVVPTVSSAQTAGVAASTGGAVEPTPPSGPVFASQLLNRDVWITAGGARVRGRVSSLSDTGLVLISRGAPTTIPYSGIVKVEKTTHRVRNGALLGLGAGAGLGLLTGAAQCSGCGSETSAYAVEFMIVFGGMGAGLGALTGGILNGAMKHSDVLYDSSRSKPTIALAPIISPTRKGVAFSMSWK
jgi:hypothetical protein